MQKSDQETSGVKGKFGLGIQNEAGQRLIEFCQENTLASTFFQQANTFFQQHRRRLYTWTSPDGQYQNQIDLYSSQPKMETLYTVNKNKTTKQKQADLTQIMNFLFPNSD